MTQPRRLEAVIEDFVYRSAEPADRVRQDRRFTRILADVVAERIRQEQIGESKREHGIDWRSCADPAMTGGDATRFVVLGEEVGEVARAMLERDYALTANLRDAHQRNLRRELVQVAAVAVAWLEAIDTEATDD